MLWILTQLVGQCAKCSAGGMKEHLLVPKHQYKVSMRLLMYLVNVCSSE